MGAARPRRRPGRRHRRPVPPAPIEAAAARGRARGRGGGGGPPRRNAAPSLLGGAVIALGVDPVEVVPGARARQPHPASGCIPAYEVRTQQAAVPPETIPRRRGGAGRAPGCWCWPWSAVTSTCCAAPRRTTTPPEPARAPLYPGTPRPAPRAAAGAAAVTMSGAGPTVVGLVPRAARGKVGEALTRGLRGDGLLNSAIH